jgi:hypothetical protein
MMYRELTDVRTEMHTKHTTTLVKVKVKFTLEQAMKAQRGSRGIAVLCVSRM